jgi:hypothetical protein
MTVVRGMLPKSLVPGVHEFVGMSYGATPEEHAPLYEMLTTKRAWEEEVMLSGMGGAPTKGEGQAVTFDDIQETYTSRYTMETVAIGFAVTKEAFDDDLYSNIARAKAQELGRAMADTKQVKAAALFNRGFNTSYNGGDGVPLFSNSHPTSSGTNFDNALAADFSESALEDACISVNLFTNDRGILISARTESLHIPAQLEFVANKILKAEYSGTSTALIKNAAGSENVGGLLMQPNLVGARFPKGIHINRRFTDPAAWFLRTSVPNGSKMFVRETLAGSDDTDFMTDNMLFKFRERYGFGWTDPRQWIGSEGS